MAASGAFTSTTAAPAVTATNSSTATGAKGVSASATGTNTNARYGVYATASWANGIGVQGIGTRYGVYSNGNLGVANGRSLSCIHCVTLDDVSPSLVTDVLCGQYPRPHVSYGGLACVFDGADMSGIPLSSAIFTNVSMIGTNLSGDDLAADIFTGADITGANLTSATDASASGSNTTCPDGTNSDNDGSICSGHGAP